MIASRYLCLNDVVPDVLIDGCDYDMLVSVLLTIVSRWHVTDFNKIYFCLHVILFILTFLRTAPEELSFLSNCFSFQLRFFFHILV